MPRYGFNVTIGADTSSFTAALKKLNTPIKEAQTSMKKINEGLKLNPTNVTLLNNKLQELRTQSSETNNKINGLNEALKNLESTTTEGYKQTDEYKMHVRDLTTEIELETEKLKKIDKEITLFGDVTSQYLIGVGTKIQEVGNKISSVGQKLMPLSMAAGGILGAAVKSAADFEYAMTGVEKTFRGNEEELEKTKQDIIDLSKATGISKIEIASVAQAAGQLGIEAKDLSEFTKVMVNLGLATNLTAEESAMAIAKIANITGMTIDEYSKFGSALTALGNNFATQESNILDMATRLASTGDLVGLNQSQILALSTAMSSLGAEAEAGGTAMSKMFKKMQLSVETNNKSLSKFAKTAGMSVSEFKKAFKEDALGAFNSFVKGLGTSEKSAVAILDDMGMSEVRLSDNILRLVNAEGLLDRAIETSADAWSNYDALEEEVAKRREDTLVKLGQVRETLGEIAIKIGDVLLPTIKDFLDGVSKFLDKFTNMSDTSKKFITTVLLIVAAVGPLLLIIGKIVSAVGVVIALIGKIKLVIGIIAGALSIPLGPILLIVGAIGALIAIFVTLYNKCEWFRDGVNAIVSTIVNKVKEIWEWLKNFFTVTIPGWIDTVKMVLDNLPYYIGYLIGTIIGTITSKIANFFIDIWNFITVEIPAIIKRIGEWVDELPGLLWKIFCEALLKLGLWLINMKKKVDEEVPKIKEQFIEGLKNLPEKLMEIGKNAIEGLVNGIKEKWEAVKNTVGDIANGIKDGFTNALNIHSPSKVMADLVGKNIMLGIEEGFVNAAGSSMKNMQSTLLDGVESFNMGKASGGNTLNIYTQELDSAKLEEIVEYVNVKFGMVYGN